MDKSEVKGQNWEMQGQMQTEIERLLTEGFAPSKLEVVNDSLNHQGHAGDDGSGESHFSVTIESTAFEGKSRIERQRMVIRVLGDIVGQRVHALAIRASSPSY